MIEYEDFSPCEKCVDGWIINKSEGMTTKCECWNTYQKELRLKVSMEKTNIPLVFSSESDLTIFDYSIEEHYKGSDREDNLKKINKFIKDFHLYKKRNLFFSGAVGTQKSTLARFIGKELTKKKYSVYYTLADTMIKELISADREDILKDKWKKITNYDLLIIDEMSEDKITTYQSGWQNTFLLPFLKNRIEMVRKSVIFISNNPIDNIGTYFEGAIQDLIYREVSDKTMVFTDNYVRLQKDFEVDKLWE